MTWTPERIGHLCRRYRDGAHFSHIGEELGCGKCAAIGKFHRLLREGHPLATRAARVRNDGTTMNRVADWMASYGGSIADCARALGVGYYTVKSAWDRIRAPMGAQAR